MYVGLETRGELRGGEDCGGDAHCGSGGGVGMGGTRVVGRGNVVFGRANGGWVSCFGV